jgi:GNAT superfamily N-acetyltransferase
VQVRKRRTSDESQLLDIAQLVHERDGYPPYLPDSDYRTFQFGHDTIGAWVAEDELGVVGQVALHPRSSLPVMRMAADALAQPVDRLGVVARLLVHPTRRRLGAGAELLDRAAHEAVELGLWPILDVVKDLADAVLLYERQGWLRIGEVVVTFDSGASIEEFVYVAPPTLRPA